jgi:hypothetical protein
VVFPFSFFVPYYFFFDAFLAFLATESAMATACFWGLPDFISVLMLLLTVLALYPFFNGIVITVIFAKISN